MITVLIVNFNSSQFIELSLEALDKLTLNEYQVFIVDNGSKLKDQNNLKAVIGDNPQVKLFFRQQSVSGSLGHSEGLDFLIKKVKSKYTVILDADAIFLKKNWDEILLKELNDQIKIIGTPVVGNTKKPNDFPLIFGVMMETKIFKELECIFLPGIINKGEDTGWQIRNKYFDNGYRGTCFEVKNTRIYKDGPFGSVLCAEYYFPENSLILSHFGRGSTLGKHKYLTNQNWILKVPVIKQIYSGLKGKHETRKWISICRMILEEEKKK